MLRTLVVNSYFLDLSGFVTVNHETNHKKDARLQKKATDNLGFSNDCYN